MQMTPARLAECKRITTILFKNPCCLVFREPVDPYLVPGYYQFIKKPCDLGTVLGRLENKQYADVDSWERDMDLIWSNAERFNGATSPISQVAKAMHQKYTKLKARLSPPSAKDWIGRITSIYEKLNRQMQCAPGSLRQHFDGKEFSGPLPTAELQRFCTASSLLTERSDVLQMIQLMTLLGVSLDLRKEETFVPVKALPPDAMKTLIAYAKDRCRSMKVPYPG
jgi:hypothetical protein